MQLITWTDIAENFLHNAEVENPRQAEKVREIAEQLVLDDSRYVVTSYDLEHAWRIFRTLPEGD